MDPALQAIINGLGALTTALQAQTQAVVNPTPIPVAPTATVTAQVNPDTGARPSAFKGKRGADAERFLLQMELYFEDHKSQYPNDPPKIRYALSLCIEDAAEWANPFIRKYLDATPRFSLSLLRYRPMRDRAAICTL